VAHYELEKLITGNSTLLVRDSTTRIARTNNLIHACDTLQEIETTMLCYLYHIGELAPFCLSLQKELQYPFFLPWHTLPITTSTLLIRTLLTQRPVTGASVTMTNGLFRLPLIGRSKCECQLRSALYDGDTMLLY